MKFSAFQLALLFFLGPILYAREDPGLEVGFTYREVYVGVPQILDQGNKLGVTKQDIEGILQAKLKSWGLRANSLSLNGSYLQPELSVNGPAYAVKLKFHKIPKIFGVPLDSHLGSTCEPSRKDYETYGIHTRDKRIALKSLERVTNAMLLDYVDSNKRYEATRKDKKLRGVDKAIYAAIRMEVHKGVEWSYHLPVQPIHAGWWLKYQDLTGQPTHSHPTAKNLKGKLTSRRVEE